MTEILVGYDINLKDVKHSRILNNLYNKVKNSIAKNLASFKNIGNWVKKLKPSYLILKNTN